MKEKKERRGTGVEALEKTDIWDSVGRGEIPRSTQDGKYNDGRQRTSSQRGLTNEELSVAQMLRFYRNERKQDAPIIS